MFQYRVHFVIALCVIGASFCQMTHSKITRWANMSHYVFEIAMGIAHQILEMIHYSLLYRANDPLALFSKINSAI